MVVKIIFYLLLGAVVFILGYIIGHGSAVRKFRSGKIFVPLSPSDKGYDLYHPEYGKWEDRPTEEELKEIEKERKEYEKEFEDKDKN